MTSRRAFLAGLGAAVFAARPAALSGAAVAPRRARLAFQVYAVRDLCARDFLGTLKAARALGFEGVETGRFYGLDGHGLKAACAEAGLELVALQLYPTALVEPELTRTIRLCREAGTNRINVAWFKGSAENENDWQLLVNVVNHAAEVCAVGGRALGALLRHSVVVGDERLVSFVPAFGFAVGKRNPASSRAWRFGARGRDQQLWLKGAPSTWRQAGYGNRFERLRTQKRTLKCD